MGLFNFVSLGRFCGLSTLVAEKYFILLSSFTVTYKVCPLAAMLKILEKSISALRSIAPELNNKYKLPLY